MRPGRTDARFFVDIQSEGVAGSMPECLSEPSRFEQAPSGGIN